MTIIACINLTGDYLIPEPDGKTVVGSTSTDPNLEALDAFIASLRNSVKHDDQFSVFTKMVAERLKTPHNSVVLSIESHVENGVLTHNFAFRSGT